MQKKYIISIFLLILCINIRLDEINPIFRHILYSSEEGESIQLSNDKSTSAEWYSSWGGSEEDYCVDMVLDSSGNIYLVGHTNSYGEGSSDMFILKFNSSRNLLWNRTWGGNESDYCEGVALDSSENIYLAGTTRSYGAGSSDMCLVKFDANGNYLWNKTWGGVSSEYCWDIEIDESGDIYLAGYAPNYDVGGQDMSLVKFYDNGDYLWNKTFGGPRSESCNDLGIDLHGNFYLAGYIYPLGQPGPDIHLIKLNRDAEYQWNQSWGGNDGGTCSGIAIDAVNHVYLCGRVREDDMSHSFVMKYSTSNIVQWNYTWTILDESFCTDIILDSLGFVYTTGVDIDNDSEETRLYVYKFGYLGEVLWKRILKSENYEMPMCIEIDPFENIYLGGLVIPNISIHDNDIFLMKNPKSMVKEVIGGYNIFVICILIGSFVIPLVVKECFRKKRSYQF